MSSESQLENKRPHEYSKKYKIIVGIVIGLLDILLAIGAFFSYFSAIFSYIDAPSYATQTFTLQAYKYWFYTILGFASTVGYVVALIAGWGLYVNKYYKTAIIVTSIPFWMFLIGIGVDTIARRTVPNILNQRAIEQFKQMKSCVHCEIKNANISHGDYRNSNFRNAQLSHVNFSYGDYRNSDFSGAQMDHVDFSYSDFSGSNFTGAGIEGSFYKTKCEGCNFKQANLPKDMRYGDFSNTIIVNSSFDGSNLIGANFDNAKIQSVSFNHTNAPNLDLQGADFSHSDFYLANLQNTKFQRSNFNKAILLKADLRGANFTGAKVTLQQLKRAESICGAVLPDGKKFQCHDTKGAK